MICEERGKPFKLVKPELQFDRELAIPVPRKCPDARHLERLLLRNPRHLWVRRCADCERELETAYAPSRPERVLCETCYHQRVHA